MTEKLTRDDVIYVARLARLSISDDEIDIFTDQLGAVLEHADALLGLDIEGVEPTAHALGLKNVFRPDIVVAGCDRDEVLGQAPAVRDGFFKVPRILGETP